MREELRQLVHGTKRKEIVVMNTSKIELQRCFICSIDSAKEYVDYNEYIMDLDGEICQYILLLFGRNFDNTGAKKCFFHDDSFISQILPSKVEDFDAFVDVIADEMHTLIQEAVDLHSGSGLFVWATVEEQPIIAFFKLNYQNRLACEIDDEGNVGWKKKMRLLPSHTQKEYDYFFINILDRKVWMSDMRCHIDNESINYMADRILKLNLEKSEKEAVNEIETAVIDTIKEVYKEEAPKKIFEYRQSVVDAAEDMGNISPKRVEEVVFADNEKAKEVYQEKLETMDIPKKPVEVSNKTKRQLKKKQKIVTESGIEILVPVEFLSDKNIFDYREDPSGKVSIVIKDISGNIK